MCIRDRRHPAPCLWHPFQQGLLPLPAAVDRHHHRRRRADAAVVQHAGADRRHRTIRDPGAARTVSVVGRGRHLTRGVGRRVVPRDLHALLQSHALQIPPQLSLIHISEPTRPY